MMNEDLNIGQWNVHGLRDINHYRVVQRWVRDYAPHSILYVFKNYRLMWSRPPFNWDRFSLRVILSWILPLTIKWELQSLFLLINLSLHKGAGAMTV